MNKIRKQKVGKEIKRGEEIERKGGVRKGGREGTSNK